MSLNTFINCLRVGPAWSHSNITVHPLISIAEASISYISLDEAIATKRFQIGEVSAEGSVPELMAYNGLSHPVLLLDGEELVGAKQNRVLNLTIMVPARTKMKIPVSCVEAGRWQHRSSSFKGADRTQFARGRAMKLAQVSHSLDTMNTRRSDQSAVWREIQNKSIRMSVESETAAMSAIFEMNQKKLNDFVSGMPINDNQVGAVFSIGGAVVGLDAFDSVRTFAKAAPKLMRSYAVDALENDADAKSKKPADEAAQSFLNGIAAADASRFKAVGLGDDLRFKGLHLTGAALELSDKIVHVVAFPGSLYESHDEQTPRPAHMTSSRTRRTFH